MSIEEQRRAIATEVNGALNGATGEDYARKVKRLVYMQEFITQFPTIAPTAWDALLQLRATTDPLVTSILDGDTPTGMGEAVRIIQPYADEWCRQHRVATASGWMELLVADTLAHIPLWERLEVPIVGFTFFDGLFVGVEGDQAQIAVESIDVRPEAKALLYASPGFQEWDMVRETRAQFRKRAITEYTQKLDEQIARAEKQAVTPAVTTVNHEWVRWTVLRRAEGRSERSIAQQHNVSRPAVTKGVKKVSAILGFVGPATTSSTS